MISGAGFIEVGVEETTIESVFTAATFIRDGECVYAGIAPAFIADAHEAFVLLSSGALV